MLSVIRRAPSARPTNKYVCMFCHRYPLTAPSHLGFTRLASTGTRPKGQPSGELIKEIRTEIEAHRAGLKQKNKGGEVKTGKEAENTSGKNNYKKKYEPPKAPQVRWKKGTRVCNVFLIYMGEKS